MQSYADVYEKMSNRYDKVFPYTFNSFVKEIGLTELDDEFKKKIEMNILFKYIGKHYKQNKAAYLAHGYINPYNFVSSGKMISMVYADNTIAMFVEYQGIEFMFYYSFAVGLAGILVMHENEPTYPYALHPDTHSLFEGLTKEWALNVFSEFRKQEEKKIV